MLLVPVGWTIWLANILAFLFLSASVLYMNRFQIGPEERLLSSCFGAAFEAYRASGRRWI
jgi:protein-S-isoprenylcysteine O-methyltransferase Ste14